MSYKKPIVDRHLIFRVQQDCVSIDIFKNPVDLGITRSLCQLGFNFDSYKEKRIFYVMNLSVHLKRIDGSYVHQIFFQDKLIYQQ